MEAAELDPPRRVSVDHLTVEEWKRSLVAAELAEFRVFPAVEHHEKWPYGGIIAKRPL